MPNGFLRDRLREHSRMECFFWNTAGYVVEEDNYDQMGDCERYPPREEEGENSYGYVATRSCQWCGEFKKNYKEDDFHYDILTEREREFEGKQVMRHKFE